ncbi:expressed unknown protein [Seminavis robusta]|uniref:Uncharacterized protein n=1 Tax=Seminavis robusta TaxID=568900 RepID=A0A9N8DCV4_9STRA|nr:expressed unknown protein [Seminavis robusta]|eukprot:Sro38_g023650.1 n/a (664) ;mRNA; r:48922-51469
MTDTTEEGFNMLQRFSEDDDGVDARQAELMRLREDNQRRLALLQRRTATGGDPLSSAASASPLAGIPTSELLALFPRGRPNVKSVLPPSNRAVSPKPPSERLLAARRAAMRARQRDIELERELALERAQQQELDAAAPTDAAAAAQVRPPPAPTSRTQDPPGCRLIATPKPDNFLAVGNEPLIGGPAVQAPTQAPVPPAIQAATQAPVPPAVRAPTQAPPRTVQDPYRGAAAAASSNQDQFLGTTQDPYRGTAAAPTQAPVPAARRLPTAPAPARTVQDPYRGAVAAASAQDQFRGTQNPYRAAGVGGAGTATDPYEVGGAGTATDPYLAGVSAAAPSPPEPYIPNQYLAAAGASMAPAPMRAPTRPPVAAGASARGPTIEQLIGLDRVSYEVGDFMDDSDDDEGDASDLRILTAYLAGRDHEQQHQMRQRAAAMNATSNGMVDNNTNKYTPEVGTTTSQPQQVAGTKRDHQEMMSVPNPKPTKKAAKEKASPPLGPPPKYQKTKPKLLYLPSDNEDLSEYQVLVRKQIEAFQADKEDTAVSTRGRNRPIVAGQVGIRCRHCTAIPPQQRQRAAIYYPSKLDRLYQMSQTIATLHLAEHCQHIPAEIRSELSKLRECKSAALGGKKYWADAGSALGLVEYDKRIFYDASKQPEMTMKKQGASS